MQKIKSFLKEQHPNSQIAIGTIQANKITFQGYQKLTDKVIEIENTQSLFEIGSITKVFTTNVLAQLILAKKVNLNDPIHKFLPKDILNKSKITLGHLANHSSGLPRLPDNFYTSKNYDEKNPYLHYDEAALLHFLKKEFQPKTKSGAQFAYSNLGSGLLGYLISKIEKKPFQKVVEDKIFKPLQMNSTTFEINKKPNSVAGIKPNGAKADYWEGGLLSGCIGIVSSANDLIKFMQSILDSNNTIVNLQLKETFQVEENHHIGLGWGIRTLADDTRSYNHGGGSDGYSCYMKLHRASQSGVIMLSNISALNENLQPIMNDLVSELRDDLRTY